MPYKLVLFPLKQEKYQTYYNDQMTEMTIQTEIQIPTQTQHVCTTEPVHVIGAGLAGCEAAWQLAQSGVPVILHEMKPEKYTPAHHMPGMAELVCSNSLRSAQIFNAVGLLKEEMRRLGSLVMDAADHTAVPAGAALAVDRVKFSDFITRAITTHPLIEVCAEEIVAPTELCGIVVIATGPLTSDALSARLGEMLGESYLHFFDAAAPIVDAASIDMGQAYVASRYGKGEACYVNCPMDREQYDAFYHALLTAQTAPLKAFDSESQARAMDKQVFEGCMPVEVMARRGYDTLRYGPLKPVGLPDPKTGKTPYAVVQLRQENVEKSMYNMVGFQTHLTFPEQKRVFGMIPGLKEAVFLRYGVMHRNTFLNSPKLLDACYRLRREPRFFFAGQMTGVEGYVESAASGLVAGVNAARNAKHMEPYIFPRETMIGAMASYVSAGGLGTFQPMNANFGIVPPLVERVRGGKKARNDALAARALEEIDRAAAILKSCGDV